MRNFLSGIRFGPGTGPTDTAGTGSPEGVVAAPVGSTYRRTDGGAGTAIYNKESGAGNTGWVADAAGGASSLTKGRLLAQGNNIFIN